MSREDYDRLRTENEHLRAMLDAKESNLADLRHALALAAPEKPPRRHWWQKKRPEVI